MSKLMQADTKAISAQFKPMRWQAQENFVDRWPFQKRQTQTVD
jgi:hypothetical protein